MGRSWESRVETFRMFELLEYALDVHIYLLFASQALNSTVCVCVLFALHVGKFRGLDIM